MKEMEGFIEGIDEILYYNKEELEKEIEQEKIEELTKEACEKAREQGIKEGIVENKIEIAKSMLKDNVEIEKIKYYTGLTQEEIINIK